MPYINGETPKQAARFAVIGVANSAIDIAAFLALTAAGLPILPANLAAWFGAAAFSFWANSSWTFKRSERFSFARNLAAFFGAGALITLGIGTLCLLLLAPVLGPLAAKLIGVAVAAIINFFAARHIIQKF